MMREKVILELKYKRGAPADKDAVFKAWRESDRIDVATCGEVEIGGHRFTKTTVVFYQPIGARS